MSSDDEDRSSFKLAAAKYHLGHLRTIECETGSLVSERFFEAQVELDGFFCEIVGAVDALLQEINTGLMLGIPFNKVRLRSIREQLGRRNLGVVVDDISRASASGRWLWKLRLYRNYSVHVNLVMTHIKARFGVRPPQIKTYLMKDPRDPDKGSMDVEAIVYLEQSASRMSILQASVRGKLREAVADWQD